jgi:ABC-type oligopeptide transport system substrate-binding subunit
MMSKRILALFVCLLMCLTTLLGCSKGIPADSDMKGAYITMYLTDEVYNFDPAYAYMNEESESIVSLLFARLFTLKDNGKLEGDLVEEYETNEDEKNKEYTMTLTLRDAWWSDKIKLTADDIVYAWKRILNSENSFACASLLFDLKNARAVKAGNCSIDDLGVCALNDNSLQITFEKPIDYDQFLLNLTSLALVPLREDYVSKGEDWAKKPGTMVTSGPFKLNKIKFDVSESTKYQDINGTDAYGNPYTEPVSSKEATYNLLVLERNACYNRNPEDKDLDWNESVEPFRIMIYCARSDEDLLAAYRGGSTLSVDMDGDTKTKDDVFNVCGDIFFMGSIPLSLRSDAALMKKADITDALSTKVFYMNQNALIKNQSTREEVALFANADVRLALSLALDREEIANTLVLAEAATGLVPNGIFNKDKKSSSFRKVGGSLLATTDNMAAAEEALARAEINGKPVKASDYSFSITVNANDADMMAMAEAAVAAWTTLGFDVEIVKRGTIVNNDYYKPTETIPEDICDDLYTEDIMNSNFEVVALDYCAYSADAYSMLSSFAFNFSGMVDDEFNMVSHLTGYNSEKYNAIIEAIYYLPYYNSISAKDYSSFMMYESEEAFQAVLDSVNAVYNEYGINLAKPEDARATLLHKAEEVLMQEMPVIPVVFNKNATLTSKSIKGVETDYYTDYKFEGTTLKNYEAFLVHFEEYVYAAKKIK